MSVGTATPRAADNRRLRSREPKAPTRAVARSAGDLPRLSPQMELARGLAVVVAVLTIGMVLHLSVLSRLQHNTAQQRRFDQLRIELAGGTLPIGPVTEDRQLESGRPVARLEIPSIGVDQVIGEGTSASALFDGPGHRRDTPLPGQVGVSVVMGRRAAYGGPFAQIDGLKQGDEITVTTGQGVFEYTVSGVRREGDPLPAPLAAGQSRLTLITADGAAFFPSGVLRVDADLEGTAVGGPPRLASASVDPAERVMAGERSSLWALALWLQSLIAMTTLAVWSWHRWGRAQTWIAFTPALIFVGLATAGELVRLLPNVT
jgi:sortase A